VSPRYARELLTEEYGCGLEGVFQSGGGTLTGVLNGVDYTEWNTTDNPHLAAAYSADSPDGKSLNKLALQRGLTVVTRAASCSPTLSPP
jgi:starch synthase